LPQNLNNRKHRLSHLIGDIFLLVSFLGTPLTARASGLDANLLLGNQLLKVLELSLILLQPLSLKIKQLSSVEWRRKNGVLIPWEVV
jgi:hypothetical protein